MTDLLLEATPELLDGWCGPLVLDITGRWSGLRSRTPGCRLPNGDIVIAAVEGVGITGYEFFEAGSIPDNVVLYLDLARSECRDRVQRKLRGYGDSAPAHWSEVDVPALANIDPDDDTRLPDGSLLRDVLGLLAVARHVFHGGEG